MTSVEQQASPPLATPWVPMWPLGGATLGELAYAEITANLTVNVTTEATGLVVVTAPVLTFDGLTPVIVEFFVPLAVAPPVSGGFIEATLWMDGVSTGLLGRYQTPSATSASGIALYGRRRIVPSAGTHTFQVRAWVSSSSGTLFAGPGNVPGSVQPAHIRVSLASPISNAPPGALMPVQYGTTLPGSPVNGQEAILVDSLTNPSYQWRFRYNANSTSPYKWEFVGGSDASHAIATQEALGTASAWANLATNGPLIVVPRAGEYRASYSVLGVNSDVNSATVYAGIAVGDTDTFDYGGGQCWFINGVAGSAPASGEVKTTLAAGDTLKLRYFSSNAVTKAFANRNLHVRPVRVA